MYQILTAQMVSGFSIYTKCQHFSR